MLEIDTSEIEMWLVLYPSPWTQDSGGGIFAAGGERVWDVPDANDDPELAGAIMRLINQIGAKL